MAYLLKNASGRFALNSSGLYSLARYAGSGGGYSETRETRDLSKELSRIQVEDISRTSVGGEVALRQNTSKGKPTSVARAQRGRQTMS